MAHQTPTPKASRKMRWALGLSLAVNLLFVGAIGGAVYRNADGPGLDRHRAPELRSYGTPYVRALPRKDRRDLHAELKKDNGAVRPSRAERRAQYDNMLAVLRADPFEVDAVRDILKAQGAAAYGMQTAAHSAWLDRISAMSEAERQSYADRLERELKKPKRKWRKPPRD
ncbi:periplasmic heavy metal sensor [Sulfitobacter mediterraneus]|uniref:RNA polymerase sigma-70 factor n=1 Tax=Sulfitobacter mediterraneus TaxID=83219 RepID=A0A061SSW3_9RHOB|nr:periplasmic heavy metal sensor [Sulfitobacter mediterraneus]KAJ02494.1 RNA polymerase sigma-70 factor [Sulfitobacter mediterraneus]